MSKPNLEVFDLVKTIELAPIQSVREGSEPWMFRVEFYRSRSTREYHLKVLRWEACQVQPAFGNGEGWSKPILARDDTLEWEKMTSKSLDKLEKRVLKTVKRGFLDSPTG
ncbi:hypothetical protein DYH09_30660 [bacterium CPR1]|nr:hypothetical protein [bacterium CPR1]